MCSNHERKAKIMLIGCVFGSGHSWSSAVSHDRTATYRCHDFPLSQFYWAGKHLEASIPISCIKSSCIEINNRAPACKFARNVSRSRDLFRSGLTWSFEIPEWFLSELSVWSHIQGVKVSISAIWTCWAEIFASHIEIYKQNIFTVLFNRFKCAQESRYLLSKVAPRTP